MHPQLRNIKATISSLSKEELWDVLQFTTSEYREKLVEEQREQIQRNLESKLRDAISTGERIPDGGPSSVENDSVDPILSKKSHHELQNQWESYSNRHGFDEAQNQVEVYHQSNRREKTAHASDSSDPNNKKRKKSSWKAKGLLPVPLSTRKINRGGNWVGYFIKTHPDEPRIKFGLSYWNSSRRAKGWETNIVGDLSDTENLNDCVRHVTEEEFVQEIVKGNVILPLNSKGYGKKGRDLFNLLVDHKVVKLRDPKAEEFADLIKVHYGTQKFHNLPSLLIEQKNTKAFQKHFEIIQEELPFSEMISDKIDTIWPDLYMSAGTPKLRSEEGDEDVVRYDIFSKYCELKYPPQKTEYFSDYVAALGFIDVYAGGSNKDPYFKKTITFRDEYLKYFNENFHDFPEHSPFFKEFSQIKNNGTFEVRLMYVGAEIQVNINGKYMKRVNERNFYGRACEIINTASLDYLIAMQYAHMNPYYVGSPSVFEAIAAWEELYEYQTNYTCWRDENSKAQMSRFFGVIPDEADQRYQRKILLRSKFAPNWQEHGDLISKMLEFRETLQELNDDIV